MNWEFSYQSFQVQNLESEEATFFPRDSLLVDGRTGHLTRFAYL